MSKVIKYYYDLMSQPSRALYIFLKLNPQIKTEFCPVALRKGEHFTQEFADNINRFQRVPCIIDNENDNFKLGESIAIFRYLVETKNTQDIWYPKSNLKYRTQIDEFLEWQHLGLRAGCGMYFRMKVIEPRLLGKIPTEPELNRIKESMENGLNTFENVWLKNVTKYLFGNNLSFADLIAACEIEQPKMAGYDPCEGRQKLTKWLNLVKQTEYYEEANAFVTKLTVQSGKL